MVFSGKTGSDPAPRGRLNLKRVLAGLIMAVVLVSASSFAWSLRGVYDRVEYVRRLAKERYGGDKVTALMALAGDGRAAFRDRNRACWALGQLGDPRALPLLRTLETGEEQAKPWDGKRYIVQYTVKKAIGQIESDFILTRWMYTRME